MYTPAPFDESRLPELHAFMRAHPFATIVTASNGRADANHIPLLLDAQRGSMGTLRGHVSRANSVWRDATAGSECLVVFHGPHSYISPGFYPSKREHGKVVPTWNYAVVHARGALAWTHDRQWLRALVDELTERHEAGRPEPWKVSDAPADYLEKMIDGIVGIEVPIASLQGKMKLSQNRAEEDRAGVLAGLSQGADADGRATAALMRGRGIGVGA